jgi:hypothetical protein
VRFSITRDKQNMNGDWNSIRRTEGKGAASTEQSTGTRKLPFDVLLSMKAISPVDESTECTACKLSKLLNKKLVIYCRLQQLPTVAGWIICLSW